MLQHCCHKKDVREANVFFYITIFICIQYLGVREILECLGHESVKTTLDTYSHLYPDKDKKLAGALNKLRRPNVAEDQT